MLLRSDLKGANVLIKSATATEKDPRGYVCKLADFGLARVLGSNRTHVSTSTHGQCHLPCQGICTTCLAHVGQESSDRASPGSGPCATACRHRVGTEHLAHAGAELCDYACHASRVARCGACGICGRVPLRRLQRGERTGCDTSMAVQARCRTSRWRCCTTGA